MAADWSSAEAEAVAHLQTLIRFDTTNPPGNELPLANYLTEALARDGIESSLLVPAANRAAVIARLKGNGKKRHVME